MEGTTLGRNKMYASDAERQKAYRLRATAVVQPMPPAPGRRRPRSRTTRLAALCSDAQQLRNEYESWLESLPEALNGGTQAERLTETIDSLEAVFDLLSDIRLPRGFGLD
jgi:hypothetical protein